MKTNEVGIAGEVRCVITDASGEVVTDSGYQKNLILNQGLEFFGGGHNNLINQYCAIGSGNSAPTVTQTKLDAYITQVTGTDTTSDYSYEDKGDGLYRMWEQKKYRFTGLNNVNISEVGLVSVGTSSTNYYLTTRALIKDSFGAPTSISVKTGETLDIYYKIHKVIDTRDKSFVINILDGDGGAVPYNVVIRPAFVGSSGENSVTSNSGVLPRDSYTYYSDQDLMDNTTSRRGTSVSNSFYVDSYVEKSYKRKILIAFGLNFANTDIRTVSTGDKGAFSNYSYTFSPFQMRLGRVSDDAPLTKTDKETLTIPLEVSWGRFEGEL